jgi:hypothetical protein
VVRRALPLVALAACTVPAKREVPDLACRDEVLPAVADAKVLISGHVTAFDGAMPLENVTVRGHAGAANLPAVFTDADGAFSYSHDTSMVPRTELIDATLAGYLDTHFYPPVPVATSIEVAFPLLTAADAAALATAGGVTLDPAKGAVLVEVVDCNGSPLPGGTVSTSPRGPDVRYFAGDAPSPDAMTTDDSGRALITNIVPASTTITGSYEGTSVRGHDVVVAANAFVLTSLQP